MPSVEAAEDFPSPCAPPLPLKKKEEEESLSVSSIYPVPSTARRVL